MRKLLKTTSTQIWRSLLMCLLFSASTMIYGQSGGDSTVIAAMADTYVRSTGTDANLNYGGDSSFYVRNSTSSAYHQLGLLKFDLNNLSLADNQVIDSAKLFLGLVYEQAPNAVVTIIGMADDMDNWIENTVTWNTGRPDTTMTLASVAVTQLSTKVASSNAKSYHWNVSARVLDEYNTGNRLLSLAVFTQKDASANTAFLSRESAVTPLRPKLVIYTHLSPVKMINLRAVPSPVGHTISLSWATTAEESLSYIQVLKNTHGEDFSALTKLAPAGGADDDTTDYHYLDFSPLSGNNRYKLAFVLSDSSRIYSNEISCFYNSADTGVSSGLRNLNVVYFLPTNSDTVPFYKERLNGILSQAQSFYRKWMMYWGYGERSFGLRRDSIGRVKIVIIHGAHDKAYYPYSNGGTKAIPEINSYFDEHPEDKQSTHTLVMMPPNIDSTGKEDVPFYGLGNGWCFALDNPDIDTNYHGSSNYIGGMIHEMGHGLNLPHNRQKMSEYANPLMGTALMGTGNSTYHKTNTFLTEASCAILNNCEVFAVTQPSSDLYEPTNGSIVSLHAAYSNGNITVNGTYRSSKPVNNIIVYNDPDGGSNYDREPWVSAPIGNDSFSVVMPITELHKREGNYVLTVALLCANGAKKEVGYTYYFQDSLPVIGIDFNNNIDTVGEKVYLKPTDDTYAVYADKANPHGADSLIQARYSQAGSQTYNKIGFIKFDLSQFQLPPGAMIKNVLLRATLQYHQVSSDYAVNVLSVPDGDDGWDETTLTWDNRPDTIATITSVTNQPAESLFQWIVTDRAKWELDSGNHILSLGVYTSLNSGANTWFYSKESADSLRRPSLMIVYQLPDTSQQDAAVLRDKIGLLQAVAEKGQVRLQWTAIAGDKNVEFEVETSGDGTVFRRIGSLAAQTNQKPGVLAGYGYIDKDQGWLNGKALATTANYYRIVEKEKMGQKTYSNVASVLMQSSANLIVYPNPVKKNGLLSFRFKNNDHLVNLRTRLTDFSGHVVLAKSFNLVNGVNELSISLTQAVLSPGIYFFQWEDSKHSFRGNATKIIVE